MAGLSSRQFLLLDPCVIEWHAPVAWDSAGTTTNQRVDRLSKAFRHVRRSACGRSCKNHHNGSNLKHRILLQRQDTQCSITTSSLIIGTDCWWRPKRASWWHCSTCYAIASRVPAPAAATQCKVWRARPQNCAEGAVYTEPRPPERRCRKGAHLVPQRTEHAA